MTHVSDLEEQWFREKEQEVQNNSDLGTGLACFRAGRAVSLETRTRGSRGKCRWRLVGSDQKMHVRGRHVHEGLVGHLQRCLDSL